MRLPSVRLLLVVGLLAGLAGPACRSISDAPSGFQPSYAGFRPYPGLHDTRYWLEPHFELASYEKLIISPVVVYLGPAGQGKAVSPDALKLLTDRFHAAIEKHFEGLTTDTPGAHVAGLRVAITGVIPGEPVLDVVTTVWPVTLVMSNIEELMGRAAPAVGQVAAEAMLIDTVTGRRMAGAISTRVGEKDEFWEAGSTWGQVEQAFDAWARELREFWDAYHEAG